MTYHKLMNVISYLRVSTDKQDVKLQRKSNGDFADKLGLNIIKELIDDGISGTLGYENRPAIKELREDFDNKEELKLIGILVYLWDRFSREKRFALNFQCDLEEYNMKLFESGTQTEMDLTMLGYQLTTTVNTIVAVEERKKMSQRLKDKIAQKLEDGEHWGRYKNYGLVPGTKRTRIKKQETFWKNYKDFRINSLLTKSATARMLRMPRATLYLRLSEDETLSNKIDAIYGLLTLENTSIDKLGINRLDVLSLNLNDIEKLIQEKIYKGLGW
jgi:DNA invertase Pin-like site-specific DNA recombinase